MTTTRPVPTRLSNHRIHIRSGGDADGGDDHDDDDGDGAGAGAGTDGNALLVLLYSTLPGPARTNAMMFVVIQSTTKISFPSSPPPVSPSESILMRRKRKALRRF